MLNEIKSVLKDTPGLKGREIAKKLGKQRKEINSYLSRNSEGLYQDENDYKWYLADSCETLCFDKKGWLRVADFEKLLSSNEDLWAGDITDIKLEFHDCAILLGAITRIVCLVNQLAAAGKTVTLDFTNCSSSFSYLCRVGLFEILNDTVEVVPEIQDYTCYYGKNKKVMEFVEIEAGTKQTDLPTKLKRSFVELAGEEHANTAFGFIAEFINNIIEHSNTPIPGVAALQVYSRGDDRKKIQTVFSDSGKGIIGTLRPVLEERYPKLEAKYPASKEDADVSLLKEVLLYGGVSGADDENYAGRGLGLKLSAKQAAKFNATVCVRQENFELTIYYRNGAYDHSFHRTNLKKINGTHICFDFHLD